MLQRVITNHPDIATVSEPWIALPLMRLYGSTPFYIDRDTQLARTAINDNWKQSTDEPAKIMARMLSSYYQELAKDSPYFLDKTPRYYKILPQLHAAFPEAYFILLLRDPIAVARSILKTWMPASIYRASDEFYEDLCFAPKMLLEFSRSCESDRCMTIRYEDLLKDPEAFLRNIYTRLGLKYSSEYLDPSKNNKCDGIFGDPVNAHKTKSIGGVTNKTSDQPKYTDALIRGYTHFLGKDFLSSYGYSQTDISGPTSTFELFTLNYQRTLSKSSCYSLKHLLQMKRLARRAKREA